MASQAECVRPHNGRRNVIACSVFKNDPGAVGLFVQYILNGPGLVGDTRGIRGGSGTQGWEDDTDDNTEKESKHFRIHIDLSFCVSQTFDLPALAGIAKKKK
jgi:hypothetical protein